MLMWWYSCVPPGDFARGVRAAVPSADPGVPGSTASLRPAPGAGWGNPGCWAWNPGERGGRRGWGYHQGFTCLFKEHIASYLWYLPCCNFKKTLEKSLLVMGSQSFVNHLLYFMTPTRWCSWLILGHALSPFLNSDHHILESENTASGSQSFVWLLLVPAIN